MLPQGRGVCDNPGYYSTYECIVNISCKYLTKKMGCVKGHKFQRLGRLLAWDGFRFPYNRKYELFFIDI